jgi:hypothetical protein
VTKYLENYWRLASIYQINEDKAIAEFMKLVDSTLTESVRPLVIEHSAFPYDWDSFIKAMKEEFRLEDADAVTQSLLMAWVFDRKRYPLGP